MAGLWLMTVMLVFFLSVGSLDAVNKENLAELIQAVKEAYQPQNVMFSLALSIKDEGKENVDQLIADNPKEEVEKQLSKGAVYKNKSLVVAKFAKPDHAEWRVLRNIDRNSEKDYLLVIYSYASPCPEKCANKDYMDNIIDQIKLVIKEGNWNRHVFVFEKVFQPTGAEPIEPKALIKALKNLGQSGIPLANIFRCYGPKTQFQCTSCSSGSDGKQVANACITQKVEKSAVGMSPKTQK